MGYAVYLYSLIALVVGLHIWSAVIWYRLTKELNVRTKQSFPPALYAFFWLIPLINWFLLWSTIGDVREMQKGEKISQWGVFLEIWLPYILMGFDIGFLLVIFLTLLLGLLNTPAILSEIIFFVLPVVIPMLASVWFFKGTNKLRLVIDRS